jgi:hypothetical protein
VSGMMRHHLEEPTQLIRRQHRRQTPPIPGGEKTGTQLVCVDQKGT